MTYPGDRVAWEPGIKGIHCLNCAPASAKQPVDPWKAEPSKPASSNGATPYFRALAVLEEAIIENASTQMTPELEAHWGKVQKLKALALAPGTAEEGRAALKQALIAAIKLAL
jgi:hypothetical protein